MMNSIEELEKLINEIQEQGQVVSNNPNLIINVNVNILKFMYIIEGAIQDLKRLEKLENANLHTEIKSVSSETEEQFKKFLDKKNEKLKEEDELLKEVLEDE